MRRKQSRVGSRVDSRDKSRTEAKTRQSFNKDESRAPAETRRECQQRRKQNAREPAETKRVSKERRKAKEKTGAMTAKMLELVGRALLYRKSATAAVVLHVESDLHEHANGRSKRRTSSVSSAPHSSNSRARLHKARACDKTAYTYM